MAREEFKKYSIQMGDTKAMDNTQDIAFLRLTIGSLMWLDTLTDEEFCVIRDEIVNVFEHHSKKFRRESYGQQTPHGIILRKPIPHRRGG